MKFYKIKIEKDNTKFIYPKGYVGGIDKKNIIAFYYDNHNFKMIALPDDVVFVDTNVTELTLEEACVIADTYAPKKTTVTDEGMLRLIEIKTRLGEKLTALEEKARNLDDETPGIKWEKSLKEKLIELKTADNA